MLIRFIRYIALLFATIASCYGQGSTVVPLKYANNFRIEKFPTHKIITVSNLWRGSGDSAFKYALVPKTSEIPKDLPSDAFIIRTPVERIAIMATVYLGHIQELDLHDRLIGASYLSHTNDPKVLLGVKEGRITPIQNGSALDVEALMLLKPDIILTSTTGTPAFDVHPQLIRANQPVVLTAGYMESHPLARSEWIKFIAAFVDKKSAANSAFEKIASKYESLAALTNSLPTSPTIFANAPYGGKWHQPGGTSYSAQAIADAGGDYLWASDSSPGGIPLDFERVFAKAAKADFWINPSSNRSLDELLKVDNRFSKFKAYKDNRVFNNTRRSNKQGGNDIWERGISHPEEVLADLISIFHPELLPNHEFVFYEQLK